MLAKIAVLFLVVMAAMALILARPRKGDGAGKGKLARRGRGVKAAAKCPDCGSWIVEGARCPCRDVAGG